MNILIVNGSPRKKGNTSIALKEIEACTQKRCPEAEIDFVDISEHHIDACTACEACKSNGGVCVMPDDSAGLMDKVLRADVIIFGSPVYWWGVSAQTKLFLDKFYARDGLFQKNPPKKLGIVITGAADLDDIQYRLIQDQFKAICNYIGWDMIFSKSFSFSKAGEIAENEEAMKALRTLIF